MGVCLSKPDIDYYPRTRRVYIRDAGPVFRSLAPASGGGNREIFYKAPHPSYYSSPHTTTRVHTQSTDCAFDAPHGVTALSDGSHLFVNGQGVLQHIHPPQYFDRCPVTGLSSYQVAPVDNPKGIEYQIYRPAASEGLTWVTYNSTAAYTPSTPTAAQIESDHYLPRYEDPPRPTQSQSVKFPLCTAGGTCPPVSTCDGCDIGQTNFAAAFQTSRAGTQTQPLSQFRKQLNDALTTQPLHVHTLVLPPGYSVNDPRLADATVISQKTHSSDKLLFPDQSFFAHVHPALHVTPDETSDRLVTAD